MTQTHSRPAGITILASAFVLIGCAGTIAFPFFAFSDDMMMLGKIFLGPIFHSEVRIHIVTYLICYAWYLVYVAYAVLGFGLWTLRNWARKSVLSILAVAVGIGVLALPLFVQPFSMAVSIMIGCVLPVAWVAWYLMRPRVRYAFGDWHASSEMPPALSMRGMVAAGFAAIAISVGLFFCSTLVAEEARMHSSGVYQMTLDAAQDSACLSDELGTPIRSGRMMPSSFNENDSEGEAAFKVPIRGLKGNGALEVQAVKREGSWSIKSLVLVRNSKRTQIVPEEPASGCE